MIENHGRVLDKDELMRSVWPDQIVEEANLTVNISALRKALGESPSEHRFIVTVPGRGYKFVAGVREAGANPSTEYSKNMPEDGLFSTTRKRDTTHKRKAR